MNQNVGNSVIVTTCGDKVTKIMETLFGRYLKNLSKDECWLIIKKKLSLNETIPLTPDLEAIGREIAKKCGGVPLLARVLSFDHLHPPSLKDCFTY